MTRPSTLDEFAAALVPGIRVTGSNSMPPLAPADVPQLSTLRLNKVLRHDPHSHTLTVQPGISFEAIQQALAWHDHWIPMDPPAVGGRRPGTRTIGGILATNSRGPLGMHTSWRTLAPRGKWIDSRGHPREGGLSAAIGTRGQTGIFTEITLHTQRRPADERMLVLFCDDPGQVETLRATLRAQPHVAYIQIIGARTFLQNPLELPGVSTTLAVGVLHEHAADIVNRLRELPILQGMETLSQTAPQAGRLRLWMTSEPAGSFAFRVLSPVEAIAHLLERLEVLAEGVGARCWAVAEGGIGQIRAVWTGPCEGVPGPLGQAVLAVGGQTHMTWISGEMGVDERASLLDQWAA